MYVHYKKDLHLQFYSENTYMFFVDTTQKKSENAAITGHFGFAFEEKSDKEMT